MVDAEEGEMRQVGSPTVSETMGEEKVKEGGSGDSTLQTLSTRFFEDTSHGTKYKQAGKTGRKGVAGRSRGSQNESK